MSEEFICINGQTYRKVNPERLTDDCSCPQPIDITKPLRLRHDPRYEVKIWFKEGHQIIGAVRMRNCPSLIHWIPMSWNLFGFRRKTMRYNRDDLVYDLGQAV